MSSEILCPECEGTLDLSGAMVGEILPCAYCGHGMKLVRIIPKLGGLPELATFECPNCEEVTTIENE